MHLHSVSYAIDYLCTRTPLACIAAHPVLREESETRLRNLPDVDSAQPFLTDKAYTKLPSSIGGVRIGITTSVVLELPQQYVRALFLYESDHLPARVRQHQRQEEEGLYETPLFDDWEEAALYVEAMEGQQSPTTPPPPSLWWYARQGALALPLYIFVYQLTAPWLVWLRHNVDGRLMSLAGLSVYEWKSDAERFAELLPQGLPLTAFHTASATSSHVRALATCCGSSLRALDAPLLYAPEGDLSTAVSLFKALRVLNFSDLTPTTVDNLVDLALPLLEEMTLCNCHVSTDLVRGLEQSTQLWRLNLTGAHGVDNEFVEQLAQHCCHLMELQLTACRAVTDVSPLAALPFLLHLDLSKTSVDRRGTERLGSAPHIKELKLCGCEKLSMDYRLWALHTLQHLDLSGNPQWDDGHVFLALPHMPDALASFSGSSAIHYLNVSHTSIGDASVRCIANLCPLLDTLVMEGCKRVCQIGPLGMLENLHTLAARFSHISYTGLEGLERSVSLTSIDLSSCSLVKVIAPLAKIATLVHLDLSMTRVTDEDLYHFAHSLSLTVDAALRTLRLKRCAQLRKIECLGSLLLLQHLDVSSTSIFNSTICSFFHLPCPVGRLTLLSLGATAHQLDTLVLSDCVDVRSIAPLGCLPWLRVLNVGYTSVDTTSLMEFVDVLVATKNAVLEELQLSGCMYISSLACVANIVSLSTLVARAMAIGDDSLTAFADHQPSIRLRELDISLCRYITSVTCLLECATLRVLTLKDFNMDVQLYEAFSNNNCKLVL